jgi:hypothetical protein
MVRKNNIRNLETWVLAVGISQKHYIADKHSLIDMPLNAE